MKKKIGAGRLSADLNFGLLLRLPIQWSFSIKNGLINMLPGLYFRLRAKKGHSKAVVAVARHLAEADYWILKKKEPYRERDDKKPVSSTQK
ncbi:MAG: hypothetical protein C0168_03575 [Candidatus Aminicenantes bacterium]|nr:MAG: hypothetical protein C0168_03575 [Candidatus Aminicenantes bacterium]